LAPQKAEMEGDEGRKMVGGERDIISFSDTEMEE
jgi:hypothetical protein